MTDRIDPLLPPPVGTRVADPTAKSQADAMDRLTAARERVAAGRQIARSRAHSTQPESQTRTTGRKRRASTASRLVLTGAATGGALAMVGAMAAAAQPSAPPTAPTEIHRVVVVPNATDATPTVVVVPTPATTPPTTTPLTTAPPTTAALTTVPPAPPPPPPPAVTQAPAPAPVTQSEGS